MTYNCVSAFFGAYLRWVLRIRVTGGDNVPRRGPVILCSNHRSWWDVPIVGACLGRRVRFMAKAELFRYPLFGHLLHRLGAFPVRRQEADRQALRRALELLASGEAVGVFPEGHRSADGKLGPGLAGAAYLALSSGVPVVPVAVAGAYRRRQLELRVGEPLDLSAYAGRRLRSGDLATLCDREIMGAIAALLGEGTRGSAVAAVQRPSAAR